MEIDEILFRTDLVTIGRFRCPVGHRRFRDSGPIRQSCFVFPRTSVVIEHEGRRPFVTDATIATLYNAGQRYERRPISPDGDRCDWYGVASDLLLDAVRPYDPDAAESPAGAMRYEQTPVDASTYLEQRRLFDAVASRGDMSSERSIDMSSERSIDMSGERSEPLEIEECVVSLLGRVLHAAYRGSRVRPPSSGRRAAVQRLDIADAARAYLAEAYCDRVGLADVARAAGCSPFHLCRSFRAVTGSTVHRHLTALRLRAALERLSDGLDLSQIAFETGFSSHSHFTAAFSAEFGVAPSRTFRARS